VRVRPLAQVHPGEQRTVRAPIDLRDGNPGHPLSYSDADADKWLTPTGDVSIMVGSSSADTPLTGTLTIQS